MRTIFISSFHQLISRNILGTPLLDFLLASGGIRIVLLVPLEKQDFFKKEFGRKDVFIEGVSRQLKKRDAFLRYLSLSAVDTKAIEVIRRREFNRISSRLFRIIGGRRLGQNAIRLVDGLLTPRGRFAALLDRYRPDLILSTDVQNENDVRLMHEARSRNIPVVGMVRSWDNFTTKGPLRVLPKALVVPNEIVKQEAITLSFVPEERIVPVGIPHYDRYLKPTAESRDAFCRRMGLGTAKKIILFSPIGNRFIRNNLLDKLVLETLSAIDASILVRIPPTDDVMLDGFKSKKANAVFDIS
ncbi:MAG: hypothetical protein WAP51_01610, partial [Candidatus Sungiibacteriota bacterium]